MPMNDLQKIQAELAKRELARRDYVEYLAYTQGRTWKRTAFSTYLARKVQHFITTETGNAYDILIVATPPQHGKSLTITETLPSWYMNKYPYKRVILASYNEDTATRFGRRNADKVKNFGQAVGHIRVGQVDRATEFELDNGYGRLISRGIMSGITGNPADLIIIDDPIKNREEADSPTYRAKLWTEWQNSIKSRLAAGAKVILIMTPWHEDDLRARLLESETNVEYVRLPVEAEDNDPMGRPVGAPLCPELGKDAAWLEQFKASYISDPLGGARAWQALYQCNPRIEGGNLVQRAWWQYFNPEDIKAFGTELISVDAAFKKTDSSDFVAITVWGKLGNNYYCRYCMNKRMSFGETLTALRLVKGLYPRAERVLIEDKANGAAIIDTLQSEMFCIPVNPKGGKESRVNAISPAIESGHVFLPINAPWVEEMLDQFSAFPNGSHDDMVDSVSQALSFMLYSTGAAEPTEPTPAERDERHAVDSMTDGNKLFSVYDSSEQYSFFSDYNV